MYNPRFGLLQVFGNLLEQGIMGVLGTHREFAQGSNGIANVRMAYNVGIQEFTKEAMVAETMLGREIGYLGGTLRGAHSTVYGIDSING
jgi:hypothetical protein